jgi:hypothetical protein
MVLNPQWTPEVYLEGAITRQDTLSRDHHGPRAILNALERLTSAYGSECVRVQQDLSIAEAQLRDYQARLGKPFLHDAYLKAAHTIDATPQRARQKQSSAEEPVTARIRRRTEAISPSNQAIASDAAPKEGTAWEAASSQNSSSKPPMTFQERITMERQPKDDGPSATR